MMKKTKDSSGAGETHVSPGSIIAMGKRSVNRFPPFESSPIAGIGDLERGYRVVWMCRNCADQCSSRTRAGTRRTSGLSALTRVVSGCQAKKWEKATRTGCDDVFCSLTPMGFALVEKRNQASGTGHRCDHAGQSVDDPGDQRGGERLCHSRSVEGFASRAEGVMASVLGRIAHVLARGGAQRVAGAGACRSRLVCALAVGDHPGLWLASVFAAQS